MVFTFKSAGPGSALTASPNPIMSAVANTLGGMDARLNSACWLGEWVREELKSRAPNADHIVRVITRETDRWFKNDQTDIQILALAQEPARTGDPRWDALIEGIVARRFNVHKIKRPEWTRATHLEEGWAPRGDLVRDVRWHILDVFSTPVELLDKGVILPRSDLDLV
jgi:hypothetical protein